MNASLLTSLKKCNNILDFYLQIKMDNCRKKCQYLSYTVVSL